MSRAEKIARRWLSAAAVATLAMLFALAVVTRSPWALFGVVPFGCLLIAAEYVGYPIERLRLSPEACAMTRDPDWRRDLDARRGAPSPAHPIILAVVQFLIQALNPHPIRRCLYPVQRWALLNHYQHTCGRKP